MNADVSTFVSVMNTRERLFNPFSFGRPQWSPEHDQGFVLGASAILLIGTALVLFLGK